jgi:hypothetical protein
MPCPPTWGTWRDGRVSCLSAGNAAGVSFGLHNRDLPRLWALDRLAAEVAEVGRPVAWPAFVDQCVAEAVGVGAWFDQHSHPPLRGGVGFPRSGVKAKASAERFVWASIGSPKGDGPFFLFRLAAVTEDGSLAPTEPGIALLRDLLATDGFGATMPHPSPACWRWMAHLDGYAREEAQVWRKLLKVVGQEPTRTELNAEFPEWPGSRADTNCMGFISRSREWGLVEPDLVEGRYRLTRLGREVEAQKGTLL